MTVDLSHVHTASDARAGLNSTLQRFRSDGVTAEPLVFGSHRKPEAVVLPWALYERLLPAVEDILIAENVRARINDPRPSVPFDEAVSSLGFDPDKF